MVQRLLQTPQTGSGYPLLWLLFSLFLSGCSGEQYIERNEKVALPQPIQSLRGQTPLDQLPPEGAFPRYPAKGQALARDFNGQPPLIPHRIYPITRTRNTCQNCHGRQASADVTVTYSGHYNNDGTLNPEFLFCTQCHVPQAENRHARVGNHFSAPGYPR